MGWELLETQKVEGISRICISSFWRFFVVFVFIFPGTSSFLRKKLQTGNIKTQVKQRGDRSHHQGQSMLCSEHLRKQSICLHRVSGNFSVSVYGDRPGTQSCCFPRSSHPAKAQSCRVPWLVTLGRASLTGLPGAGTQAGNASCFQQLPITL